MFKLTKLTNLFFGALLVGVLGACSPTPNNVTLTLTPSSCVTGVYPGYEATATLYSNGYPLNATMPSSSPYCMAVTLTNNNTGTNANNIQVFQGGLQLSYTVAGVSYLANLIDFNASGIPQSTYTYAPVQQLGNIALFDPSNCVTTIGSHVNTLNQGGGQCTFYLGMVGESLPVGTYPLQLQVNYTNGNTSYFVNASFNQRVNLYAGGDFTAPSSVGNYLALYNGIATNVAESLPVAFPGQNVKLLTRDAYGDLFAYDGSSVYVFSGGGTWTNIGLPSGVTQINALSNDNLGNVFAATNAGVWTYSLANTTLAWSNIAGSSGSGNFAAVQATVASGSSTNNIFATNNSYSANAALLACTWASGGTCAWSSIFESSSQFNSQALALQSNTVQYLASGSSVWQNNNGTSGILLNESSVDTQAGPIGIDPVGLMYVSFHNSISNLLVPAVFSNSSSESTVLTPLSSSSGQALAGAANGVALQSISYNGTSYAGVAGYGSNSLTSSDFTGTTSLAYLLLVYTGTVPAASTNWVPISGLNGAVNSVAFASMLTTY
jgi:hypothetical protein